MEIGLDAYPFDYGIPGRDQKLLFRRVVFNGNARRTWDSMHAAADAVNQVVANRGDRFAPYVIGYEKDPGDTLPKQIQALD